jgi:hypothetical protein
MLQRRFEECLIATPRVPYSSLQKGPIPVSSSRLGSWVAGCLIRQRAVADFIAQNYIRNPKPAVW